MIGESVVLNLQEQTDRLEQASENLQLTSRSIKETGVVLRRVINDAGKNRCNQVLCGIITLLLIITIIIVVIPQKK